MNSHILCRPLPGAHTGSTAVARRSLVSTTRRLALLAILALAATGCASQYKFGVETIKQTTGTEAPRLSYRLLDARPSDQAGDPRFEVVARDVHTALSSKGLYAAPEGTTPELTIEVDYGMSAPVVKRITRSEPVYVVLPPQSSGGLRLGSGIGGTGALPTYLGSREIPYTVKTYRKFLRLTARETEPTVAGGMPRQVWSVLVTNEDKSNNLREYARLMVAAAMDNIGEDDAAERRVALKREDGRVSFVAEGAGST